MKALLFLALLTITLSKTVFFKEDFLPKTNPTHYGNPSGGCLSDEVSASIEGLTGDACIPECDSTGSCATDVPTGTTVSPLCALQTSTGEEYCALICAGPATGNCPTGATCETLSGAGICLYPAQKAALGLTLHL